MKRSKFSLSHTRLLTCDMGELIPIGCIEVLPGDGIQQTASALVRCSPLLTPVMHPVDVRIHHWFVPYRLVWEDFESFITGGPDGNDASVYPTITFAGGVAASGLGDYLGIPPSVANTVVSALPYRAYAMIWNEWYRDQDLQTALTVDVTSGDDTTTNTVLQNCGWEKDYFTSARPWEQKGPSISIPLGTSAPVTIAETGPTPGARTIQREVAGSGATAIVIGAGTANAELAWTADLSAATAANVNLLREAFALQRFEEARARYGSRYVEYLRYLGVRSSDARLQRPEYLGGGRDTIQFSEVLSSNGASTGNLGQLGGHGISAMRSNRYRRHFEEHGAIISVMSIRPKTIYLQGLPRFWNRRTKEDFWQQELQHIGQQEVLNKEIYLAHATPEGTFGYQDRYDEYRRQESWISGNFRSSLTTWHFGRSFASDPALNATFVKCVPSEVPFAASSADVMWIQVRQSIQARRLVAGSGSSYIY